MIKCSFDPNPHTHHAEVVDGRLYHYECPGGSHVKAATRDELLHSATLGRFVWRQISTEFDRAGYNIDESYE